MGNSSIKIEIMNQSYYLPRSKFFDYERKDVEDLGLSGLSMVLYIMKNINRPVHTYHVTMWTHIVDVYILLRWLGFRDMNKWISEAKNYSEELTNYLDGSDMSAEINRK